MLARGRAGLAESIEEALEGSLEQKAALGHGGPSVQAACAGAAGAGLGLAAALAVQLLQALLDNARLRRTANDYAWQIVEAVHQKARL